MTGLTQGSIERAKRTSQFSLESLLEKTVGVEELAENFCG